MLAEYYDITCDKFSETKNGYKYEVELTDKSGRFNALRGVYTSRATSKTNLLTEFNDKLITKIKYGSSAVANVFGGKGTGVLDGEYSSNSYTTFEFKDKYNADLAIKDTTNYDLENAENIGIYVSYYGDTNIKHIDAKYGAKVDLLKNFDSQLKSGSQSDGKWYVDEKCTTEFVSETWPSYSLTLYTKVTPKEGYAKIEQRNEYGINISSSTKYFNVASGNKYNIASSESSSYNFVSATINGVKTTEVEQTLEAGKTYEIVAKFEQETQTVKANATKAQEKQFNAMIDNFVSLYGTKQSYTVTYEVNGAMNSSKVIESYDAVNKKLVIVSENRNTDGTVTSSYKMLYDFNNNKIITKKITDNSAMVEQTSDYNSYYKLETSFAKLLKTYENYYSVQDFVDDIKVSYNGISSVESVNIDLTKTSLQVKANLENGYDDNVFEFNDKNQITKITKHSVVTGENGYECTNVYTVSYSFDSTLWNVIE